MENNSYRIATDEEKQSYHDFGCDESYSLLLGPNGFECLLTEPEDRNWYRDGKAVVDELNRLLEENNELKRKDRRRRSEYHHNSFGNPLY